MTDRKPVLSVRVDDALLKKIDALVERTGVGRAEIVERCLAVGLQDEEEFVAWLESPVKGPFASLLTHPAFLEWAFRGTRYEVDKTQQKVRKNVRERQRGVKGRPVLG